MIKEDYVSFEVAKLLKEKGFDGVCRCYYPNGHTNLVSYVDCRRHDMFNNESCIAPTLQMACKWLREEFDLNIEIDTIGCKDRGTLSWRSTIFNLNNQCECYYNETCSTYEEAAEIALKYVLENLI